VCQSPGVADVGKSAGNEDLLGVTGVEEASAGGDDPDGRGERDRVEPVGCLLGGKPKASACRHQRARSGQCTAQDTPVFKNLSAADMLHLTRNLNRRFDQHYAKARLAELGISGFGS